MGGGQVPQMNPRPVQTGKQIFHFSRTFRHYVDANMNAHYDPANGYNDNWHIIPYMYMCSSLKPRDFQMINTISKRWRVLSCGFNMEHIIPVIDTETTTGGALTGNVNFNTMPYMESFIDKSYILPDVLEKETYTFLPNNEMLDNNPVDRKSATLPLYTPKIPDVANHQNLSWKAYEKTFRKTGCFMELMNSCQWGTIQPQDSFSFEWTPSQLDLNKWRHAMQYVGASDLSDDASFNGANVRGRWDGGMEQFKHNSVQSSGNMRTNNDLIENCTHPGPIVLIRPAQFLTLKNDLVKIGFQVLIKYHCTIECDVNDMFGMPIFMSSYDDSIAAYKNAIWDIYGIKEATKAPAYKQNCGSNIVKRFTGPVAVVQEF